MCSPFLYSKSDMEALEGHIRNLEAMTKKITHCPDCGSTWYDDGFTVECPQCRMRKLEEERADLVRRVEDEQNKAHARHRVLREKVNETPSGQWFAGAADQAHMTARRLHDIAKGDGRTRSASEILRDRYVGDDPVRQAELETARKEDARERMERTEKGEA